MCIRDRYGALMLITGVLFIVDFKVPKVQSKGLVALGILVKMCIRDRVYTWLALKHKEPCY